MTRTTKKVKVGITLSEAQDAANTFAEQSIQIDKLTAEMNAKLQKVREAYEPKITECQEALEEPEDVLRTYAIENRDNFKNKSVELANVVIGFRTNPPSVTKIKKVTWNYITALMKQSRVLKQFVKVKEDVDKAAILKAAADDNLVKALDAIGVTIEQEEQFYVSTKKEDVK